MMEIQTSRLNLNQENQENESDLLTFDKQEQIQVEPKTFSSDQISLDSLELMKTGWSEDLPVGEVIASVDAVGWNNVNVDIR